MKRYVVFCLLTFTFTSSIAHAEDVVIIKNPTTLIEGTSEANRHDKTFTATYQLLGAGVLLTNTRGLAVGHFLKRNTVLLAEANFTNDGVSFLSSSIHVKGHSLGVHVKQFFGNSFYAKMGVDYRRVNVTDTYRSLIDSSYDSVRAFDGDSAVFSLNIGNQWQWENFTLGCDWIGLAVPFAHKLRSESLSGRIDDIDRENHRKNKEMFFSKGMGQLLKFYLGVSF